MKAEFTAIIEAAPEGGFWPYAPRFLVPTGKVRQSKKPKTVYDKPLN